MPWQFWYFIIGLSYWAINIFLRKLHLKNDLGDGWFLVPFWIGLWPICFVVLIIMKVEFLIARRREEWLNGKV